MSVPGVANAPGANVPPLAISRLPTVPVPRSVLALLIVVRLDVAI